MVLPTPSEHFFLLYEKTIFHFIWNGKPDKVNWAYLYNEYEFGGQKLLNIIALTKGFSYTKAKLKSKLVL